MELREQLGNLTEGTLAATLDAAMIVSVADGSLSDDEVAELADSLVELSGGQFDRDTIYNLMVDSISRISEHGADELIPAIGDALGYPLNEVALAMASAAAWTRNGINTAEGVALQKLRAHLGIDEDRYFQLLSLGKQLSQS